MFLPLNMRVGTATQENNNAFNLTGSKNLEIECWGLAARPNFDDYFHDALNDRDQQRSKGAANCK